MTLDVHIVHRLGGFDLDVAFSVSRPGVTALFGPSGSGKTTVVNAVAGLLRPDGGRIGIDGTTVVDTGAGIFTPPRLRAVGYVFQDGRLFPHMSVRSNLEFGERRARGREAHTTFAEVVDLLDLAPLLERRPGRLSGGERQRVALGRALLSRPRLLLLDEPLAALDRERKEEILPLLQRLRDVSSLPMVYVSHSIEEVTRLADDVVVMRDGRVRAHGSIFDVTSRPDLFPRASEEDAGAVIEARVEAHDAGGHLTELSIDGGRLWVPRLRAAEGESVRLRILARDVMLATSRPEGISANNVLEGIITAVHAGDGPGVDVQVACGTTRILARVTRRSMERLELEAGSPVFAVVKSIAADRRGA